MKASYVLMALAALLLFCVLVVSADPGEANNGVDQDPSNNDYERQGKDEDQDDDEYEDEDEDDEYEDEYDDDNFEDDEDGKKGCQPCPKKTTTTMKCDGGRRTTTMKCDGGRRTTTMKCDGGRRTTTMKCDGGRTTTPKNPPKPNPCQKVCDWDGLEECREANIKKFDHCLYRKRWAFVDCNEAAEAKFEKCLHNKDFDFDFDLDDSEAGQNPVARSVQESSEGVDSDPEKSERHAQCKKRFDQDKERCLVQRKASHAGCWAARECRDFKCLRFIKGCKPCPKPPVTTTTVPPVSSMCPATDYFGAASDFNVFITGSDLLIYDLDMQVGDIEGRVAVNGGFRVNSFGTAQNYNCANTAEDAAKYNLIVSGKMDYANGELFCGSSIYEMSGNNPSLRQQAYGAVNTLASSDQDLKTKTGLDFQGTTGYLQGVSDFLCSYSAGTHDNLLVGFYSPSQLTSINLPAGDYVAIVNIQGGTAGTEINFSNFAIPSLIDPSRVIYNVCGKSNYPINISSFELNGHLLALNCDVTLTNGHVTGNVYSRSLVGSGSGQVNLAPCPAA